MFALLKISLPDIRDNELSSCTPSQPAGRNLYEMSLLDVLSFIETTSFQAFSSQQRSILRLGYIRSEMSSVTKIGNSYEYDA